MLRFEMDKFWKLLSVNTDTEGLEFISTMEAENYPFYASQFHPEKNSFEWANGSPAIPHTRYVERENGANIVHALP